MSTYTISVEDYLKAIYELSRVSGSAGTTDVASRLAVASASVSAMVRRLVSQRLVSHELYGGLPLTKKGRTRAPQLVRRPRGVEAYPGAAPGNRGGGAPRAAERPQR